MSDEKIIVSHLLDPAIRVTEDPASLLARMAELEATVKKLEKKELLVRFMFEKVICHSEDMEARFASLKEELETYQKCLSIIDT